MCTYPVQPCLHILLAVCTFLLHIPVYIIKSTVYCIAHFISLHILPLIFIFLLCPLSGPVLIYISLLIISCIIEYVTNKRTLTYHHHH